MEHPTSASSWEGLKWQQMCYGLCATTKPDERRHFSVHKFLIKCLLIWATDKHTFNPLNFLSQLIFDLTLSA